MDAASVPGGKAQLLGKNPFDIEQFAGPLRHYLGAGSRAVSSLKIALWDFIGKAAQQPLYKLWGAAKERVPAYASAGQSDGAEEPAAHVALPHRGVEQGQRHQHERHRGDMGSFDAFRQHLEAANVEIIQGVEAHRWNQKAGGREQRPGQPCEQSLRPTARQAVNQPEQRHWPETVERRREGVVGEAGRNARHRRERGHAQREQRRVGVLIGNASVPEGEPSQVGEMIEDVTGEADERRFDRLHLVRVFHPVERHHQGYVD